MKRFTISLFFVFPTFLIGGYLCAAQESPAAQESTVPSSQELYDGWVAWVSQLRSMPPHRYVATSVNQHIISAGYEDQEVTVHAAGEQLGCTEAIRRGSGQSGDAPAMEVDFTNGQTYYSLGRPNTSSKWMIRGSYRASQVPPGQNFRDLYYIPGNLDLKSIDLDRTYEVERRVIDPDRVELKLTPRRPKAEKRALVTITTVECFVTFNRNHHWLPEKIDQRVSSDGSDLWFCHHITGVIPIGDTFLPKKLEFGGGTKRGLETGVPEWTEVKEAGLVPLETVQEVCSLAYWELMQIDERRRQYRWYIAAGLIIAGLGLWQWQVRKGRQ